MHDTDATMMTSRRASSVLPTTECRYSSSSTSRSSSRATSGRSSRRSEVISATRSSCTSRADRSSRCIGIDRDSSSRSVRQVPVLHQGPAAERDRAGALSARHRTPVEPAEARIDLRSIPPARGGGTIRAWAGVGGGALQTPRAVAWVPSRRGRVSQGAPGCWIDGSSRARPTTTAAVP